MSPGAGHDGKVGHGDPYWEEGGFRTCVSIPDCDSLGGLTTGSSFLMVFRVSLNLFHYCADYNVGEVVPLHGGEGQRSKLLGGKDHRRLGGLSRDSPRAGDS